MDGACKKARKTEEEQKHSVMSSCVSCNRAVVLESRAANPMSSPPPADPDPADSADPDYSADQAPSIAARTPHPHALGARVG